MAKCANCEAEAYYVYTVTPDFAQEFCADHLPRFLSGKDYQHMVSTTAAFDVAKQALLAPPVAEPVVEPVTEPEAAVEDDLHVDETWVDGEEKPND